MNHWIAIAVGMAFVGTILADTGLWRLAFAAFCIPSRQMSVKRLGLHVEAPADVERVNTLLQSFAGGFNKTIVAPLASEWRAYCDSRPVLYRPFAHEGAAMGYTLRHLFRFDPAEFEEELVKPRPEFRYLHYVGLGFWWAMRKYDAARVQRGVHGLDPLHRYLCYDGYGFKHAFFDYPKNPEVLRRLDAFEGYARNSAYQGVGRAFFFLYMARPDLLIEHLDKLGQHAEDAVAGVGLAAVFVNPDRLEQAQKLGAGLPASWHPHYHLGMCFGLKARSINDVEQFERDMAQAEKPVQDAVCASVRECDRVELQVRAEQRDDGYRKWRMRVTSWMADHVEYPMAGVTEPASPTEQRPADRAHA